MRMPPSWDKGDYSVPSYVKQIECLSCSNSRNFVHHMETTNTLISQAEALSLPRGSMLSCGRCGSTSLVRSWGDATPYATKGYVGRRRRRRSSAALAAAAQTSDLPAYPAV
jgi:hypothetical protein